MSNSSKLEVVTEQKELGVWIWILKQLWQHELGHSQVATKIVHDQQTISPPMEAKRYAAEDGHFGLCGDRRYRRLRRMI